jgi:hypothetical protein
MARLTIATILAVSVLFLQGCPGDEDPTDTISSTDTVSLTDVPNPPLDAVHVDQIADSTLDIFTPEENPCKQCQTNADCQGGLICYDDDNNPLTYTVCTKPYDPAVGCPAGMYGNFNVSKFCVCQDCGGPFNLQCLPNDCPIGLTSPTTMGKCQPIGDKCDCKPIGQEANPCKQCQTNADCAGGLVCIDDDNNTLTPTVCTKPYVVADGCPAGMYGDFNISKYCICEDCGGPFNPQCLPNDCPIGVGAASTLGKCKSDAAGGCDCKPPEQPANPCKQCLTNADCVGGLVCIDDDNNTLTPTVCTKPYVVAVGCPVGMYGDFNISKYCICEDCGGPFNPQCLPNDCPIGTGAASTLGKCKSDAAGGCDCKPAEQPANPCKQCQSDADCTGGLVCRDDDNNTQTPKVCTKPYVVANGCPTGMYGDYAVSKFCICDHCGSDENPQCLPNDCPNPIGLGSASMTGKCKSDAAGGCGCKPVEATNPCVKCQTDADCTGGLVCRDDDNTALTIMVCTKLFDPVVGCPPGMYGDYNVSKHCICKTCSSEINPLCEPKACAVGTGAAAQPGNCKPDDNNGPCICKN